MLAICCVSGAFAFFVVAFVFVPLGSSSSLWESILVDTHPSRYRTRMLNSSLMKRFLSHQRMRARTQSARSALSSSTDLTSSWTIISCITRVSWSCSFVR